MSWTQPCCYRCWYQRNPHRRPHAMTLEHRTAETCCYCGELTLSGIYVRVNPATVQHPTEGL